MDGLNLFKKGFAVGRSDIVQDCWHFRFYEEVFTVKSRDLKTKKKGKYLIARIEDVKKAAHG